MTLDQFKQFLIERNKTAFSNITKVVYGLVLSRFNSVKLPIENHHTEPMLFNTCEDKNKYLSTLDGYKCVREDDKAFMIIVNHTNKEYYNLQLDLYNDKRAFDNYILGSDFEFQIKDLLYFKAITDKGRYLLERSICFALEKDTLSDSKRRYYIEQSKKLVSEANLWKP
jgi:hypothetical protein